MEEEPLYIINDIATKKDAQLQITHVYKATLVVMRILFCILTIFELYIYLRGAKNFILLVISFIVLIFSFFYPMYLGYKWEKRVIYKHNQNYLTFHTEFYEDYFRCINIETKSITETSYNKIKCIVETKSEIILTMQYKIDDYFIHKKDCVNNPNFRSFLYSKIN